MAADRVLENHIRFNLLVSNMGYRIPFTNKHKHLTNKLVIGGI